ncbi:MAG: GntR family transcriptional regulator [Saprospiraceae bacterium]|nr:GntR family transcriptional regulator [Saprospiraceae bacterium]
MFEQRDIPNSSLVEFQIDHESGTPLHLQVEALLRDLIADPQYQNGELLPKEVDMAKRLGISRNTIRQATNKLVHEGLLVRKKGVGTTVGKPSYTSKLKNWFSFSQEMDEKGLEFINYNLKSGWIKASKEVAKSLQLKKGRKVLKLERLRGLDDGPFVFFQSYFHPRVGFTGKEDFSRHLYDMMEEDYATVPSISKEEIKAILANDELAKLLNIAPGAPILLRKRIVCDPGDRPIESNVGYYRGDRFSYSIDIRR